MPLTKVRLFQGPYNKFMSNKLFSPVQWNVRHNEIYIRGYSKRFMHKKIARIGFQMGKRRMKILVILREARTCVEKKNQLHVTECFIALMICSTCFGHFYAHHQELETICVLLQPVVCSAWLLVVGGQIQGSRL